MEIKRIVAGFLVAPLAPALLHGLFTGGLPGFLFGALFSFPATLILGLPALIVFSRLGWLNLWATVAAGAVLGALACLLLAFAFNARLNITPSALLGVAMLIVYGTIASATFWFVALRAKGSNHAHH